MKKRATANQQRLAKARAEGAPEYVVVDGVLMTRDEAEALER